MVVSPSTVVTGPSTALTGRLQEDRARPLISTMHAPHRPSPQPKLGPARPTSWRRTSSSGVSGSHLTVCSAPLTTRRNSSVSMISLTVLGRPCQQGRPVGRTGHGVDPRLPQEYAFVCRDVESDR